MKKYICPSCGKGKLEKSETSIELLNGKIAIENVSCEKCIVCGEEIVSEKEYHKAYKKMQKAKKALKIVPRIKTISI